MANHITSVFEFANNHLMVTRNTVQIQESTVRKIGDTIVTQTVTTEIVEQTNKKVQ